MLKKTLLAALLAVSFFAAIGPRPPSPAGMRLAMGELAQPNQETMTMLKKTLLAALLAVSFFAAIGTQATSPAGMRPCPWVN